MRVACPARGTLLASKRLDAYLSVFKWALELAGIPVAPELVDFLARSRSAAPIPTSCPGLAAQIPDSPLVAWLHAGRQPHRRRAARGRRRPARATRSRRGSRRCWPTRSTGPTTISSCRRARCTAAGRAPARRRRFLLDRGGKVSHFNYFTNERTAEAIVDALVQDAAARLPDHRPAVVGRQRRRPAIARRAPRRRPPAARSRRCSSCPASSAATSRSATSASGSAGAWSTASSGSPIRRAKRRVEPDGPIGRSYDDLVELLSRDATRSSRSPSTGGVPIEDEAQRLADAVDDGARRAHDSRDSRCGSSRIRWAACSRATMQLERPDDVEAHDGARRRARPDARHAERRLVGADAGAVGRRHVRQHAGRGRRAVSTAATRAS